LIGLSRLSTLKPDLGEGLVSGAIRETAEETNLVPANPGLVSVGNETGHDAHFITLGFVSKQFKGELKAMEPDEITEWVWFDLYSLPGPMFPPTMKMINNYKSKRILGE